MRGSHDENQSQIMNDEWMKNERTKQNHEYISKSIKFLCLTLDYSFHQLNFWCFSIDPNDFNNCSSEYAHDLMKLSKFIQNVYWCDWKDSELIQLCTKKFGHVEISVQMIKYSLWEGKYTIFQIITYKLRLLEASKVWENIHSFWSHPWNHKLRAKERECTRNMS